VPHQHFAQKFARHPARIAREESAVQRTNDVCERRNVELPVGN
jgi:hypothetical protein